MTTQRGPRISAPRLELRGARPTSYSRLAVAEATAVLGIVSITCGVLGLFDDAGDALFLIGLGLASIAFALLARRTLDRTHRPSPGRVLSGLAFTWLTLVVIGTGVYLATGTIDRVDDAFVESAAGFSTTSLTTLDPSELNVPMQLWRAGTQWIGGLVGIIVGVVSLPLALRGGMLSREGQHARERLAPTPVVGRRRVMLVYGAISTLVGLGYVATGLGARDSLVHTFTTVSTGGFSSNVDSFAGLGAGRREPGAHLPLVWMGNRLCVSTRADRHDLHGRARRAGDQPPGRAVHHQRTGLRQPRPRGRARVLVHLRRCVFPAVDRRPPTHG